MKLLSGVRLLIAACAVLTLAGCEIVNTSLKPGDVKTFRYAGATVVFEPGANIWWGDGERAYAATKGIDATEAEAAAKTLQGKAYLHAQIEAKLKSAMEKNLSPWFKGSNPVRVRIVVKNVTIASAVQRVVFGGSYVIQAGVDLVDARTGAVIVHHPGMLGVAAAGQGIVGVVAEGVIADPPIDRTANQFAYLYRLWLVPGSDL